MVDVSNPRRLETAYYLPWTQYEHFEPVGLRVQLGSAVVTAC